MLQSPGWAINLVVLSSWFPRTGRGLLIGVWASNATAGDLVGTQIYKLVAADSENYYKVFYIVSSMVFSVGLVNFFFLVENPAQVGININENGVLAAKETDESTGEG